MYENTQPILRLRGGGADQKRKESRKRKFEQLRHDHPIASLIGESKATDGPSELQTHKRRKQATNLPSSCEATAVPNIDRAVEAHAEGPPMPMPVVEVEQDGQEIEDENSRQPPKSQRFIVFIGILSICFDHC